MLAQPPIHYTALTLKLVRTRCTAVVKGETHAPPPPSDVDSTRSEFQFPPGFPFSGGSAFRVRTLSIEGERGEGSQGNGGDGWRQADRHDLGGRPASPTSEQHVKTVPAEGSSDAFAAAAAAPLTENVRQALITSAVDLARSLFPFNSVPL